MVVGFDGAVERLRERLVALEASEGEARGTSWGNPQRAAAGDIASDILGLQDIRRTALR